MTTRISAHEVTVTAQSGAECDLTVSPVESHPLKRVATHLSIKFVAGRGYLSASNEQTAMYFETLIDPDLDVNKHLHWIDGERVLVVVSP